MWIIKIRPLRGELKSVSTPPAKQHIGHAAEDGNKHARDHPQHPLERRFKGMVEGVPDAPQIQQRGQKQQRDLPPLKRKQTLEALPDGPFSHMLRQTSSAPQQMAMSATLNAGQCHWPT